MLRGAIASRIGDDGTGRDVELVTEAWWASLHGVVSLALSHRVRPGAEHARLLVRTVTDYVNHNRYAEPGKAGSVAVFGAFLAAFDDFRVEVDDVIDAGATVVGRYTYRGRHTGTFLGVPASNAEIEMHTIDIWRVRDGLFAEHWDELNTLELFQQMARSPRSRWADRCSPPARHSPRSPSSRWA